MPPHISAAVRLSNVKRAKTLGISLILPVVAAIGDDEIRHWPLLHIVLFSTLYLSLSNKQICRSKYRSVQECREDASSVISIYIHPGNNSLANNTNFPDVLGGHISVEGTWMWRPGEARRVEEWPCVLRETAPVLTAGVAPPVAFCLHMPRPRRLAAAISVLPAVPPEHQTWSRSS